MNHDIPHTIGIVPQLLLAVPFVIALIVYILFVSFSNHPKRWPIYRTVCWILGVLFAVVSVAGPLAHLAHQHFTAHMLGHLFLGMLAPLLMVVAAPMTLVLRTLPVPVARRLTRLLRSTPSRIATHPIVASLLNIGGLWVLYTTELYSLMHENLLLHLVIHFHVFLAGYLFTVSMLYVDPMPHRVSFLYRAVVLVFALAGHGILSKFVYAHPPPGVPFDEAKAGGMLMYYGGDAIDAGMICILCLQWYRSTQRRAGNAYKPVEAKT
ncbi:cytochrome c oxidase assembly protein [Bacillus piscicola]|uniref:cytochrome c oxidase assembly protein n=1 Tax=Bacillus piscicola TaxID=1632684 RepID=UPI001F088EE2|nr:cytochrome c oxidase assembly protein [Bacillus piscicola]